MSKDRQEEPASAPLDLAAVRARLSAQKGPELWRSLDELAATPGFQDWLHREFPRQASEWVESPADGLSRRRFLQLSSASLALAGLTACTKQPLEHIVPYVKQPEEIVLGRPLFFATTCFLGGYGTGVLAESHQGRPTKVEGNPDHPASLGATDVFAQASVLDLYDPGRSQSITGLGRIRTWGSFVNEVSGPIRALRALGGEGIRFLTGTVTSPTLADQMKAILAAYPKARWHRWEAAAPPHAYRASVAAFGAPRETVYDLTQAKVVLALDSDLLTRGPGSVRYARDFSRGRQVRVNRRTMNRLYAVESSPTNTGTLADHRLALPPAGIEAFALALAVELGVVGAGGAAAPPAALLSLSERTRAFVVALARDLRANAGASVVAADGFASPAVQVLAHAMNEALGNVGKTIRHLAPVEADPVDHAGSIGELARDLEAGKVELLVVFDANPVYTAPADLDFAKAIRKARLRVHLGLYADETAELCQWHLPAAHPLESWGDARAFDGTASIAQPLIDPLYGGKSAHELLAVFSDRIDATSYDAVHDYWTKRLPGGEAAFRKALHDGVVPEPAPAAPSTPATQIAGGAVAQAAAEIAGRVAAAAAAPANAARLPLIFRPDPTVHDGSFANNAWLQELPKPLTKLTWDNALILSPKTAERLKVGVEQVVEIAGRGGKVRVPVWVQPGHADGCATLHLGYGRWRAGAVGNGTGANAYALRTSDALAVLPAAAVRPTEERAILASTQNHHLLESGAEEIKDATGAFAIRRPVRTGTLAEFAANPGFLRAGSETKGEGAASPESEAQPEPGMSLYPDYPYAGYKWGMAIDLNVCTGCSACVVACQAENNIPTVGKEQVLKGRAMHWLRIDRYFEGHLDDPLLHHQPVPCMQCENAPCEVVCPVAATTHSSEGLNDMVYNRCVGTRYCSNNCPYKVRRFNFLRYSNHDVPVLKMLENPDVTVRMRGVMEKCTYCVQRINEAKIDSEVAGRAVRPGDVQTACQQVCPTEAIVFGDLNGPAWEATRRRAEPLNYSLLEELNTRPRTTYLAKLRNENPEIPVERGR
ncbi:MAG TPA: TAT-variant-translocated molybdopterin oxidoreductase [Thermoanaerobaculia bacterium]